MQNSELVTQKLDELIRLAQEECEPSVQVVLFGLRGARLAGDEELLAARMQDFIRDVLLPRAQASKENQIAAQN